MSLEAIHAALNYLPAALTPGDRLVAIGVANHVNPDSWEAFPSLKLLTQYTGMERRSVRRCLRRLEEAGVLVRVMKAGGSRKVPDALRPNLYLWRIDNRGATIPLEFYGYDEDEIAQTRAIYGESGATGSFSTVKTGEKAKLSTEGTERSGGRGPRSPQGEDRGVRGEGTERSGQKNRKLNPTQPEVEQPLQSPSGPVGERVPGDQATFEDFWEVYPRHVAKQAAIKAWDKATKVAAPSDIIAGAMRYREDPSRKPEFTAHPATWLNQGRWEDEYEVAAPSAPVIEYGPTDERVRGWLGLAAQSRQEALALQAGTGLGGDEFPPFDLLEPPPC